MRDRTRRGGALLTVLATGALVLVGCGGSDDAGAGDTTTTTIVGVEPAITEPPVTAPATTGPSSTTQPSTSAPTTTADPETLDAACLDGGWVLDSAKTNELYTTLLPGVPLTTEGSLSMTFDGNAVETYINIVATFTVPDGSVSGPLDQHFVGTYEVQDGAVLITNDVIEGGWGHLTGTIGGVAIDVPVPPAELPPFTGGPATCDGQHLSLQYTSGLADAVADFDRV